jgi:hypothetical protein
MRLRITGFGRVVKRDLGIEFGREQLTSYGGLELVRRYFQCIWGLKPCIAQATLLPVRITVPSISIVSRRRPSCRIWS